MSSVECQSNYKAVVKAFKDPNIRSIGLEGGTRSAKTYDWSIFLYQYLLAFENKKIVIGRDTKANLNTSTYKTIQDVFKAFRDPFRFPKYSTTLRVSGNEIDFIGLNDGDGRAQGLESDLLIVNEADLCDKDVFDQLEQRNKDFIIIDYNPRQLTNWTYDREKLDYHTIHYTTIRDNKFAPRNAVEKVMSYEPTDENIENGTANKYLWEVYGLGKRASGEDAIFDNIKRFNTWPSEAQCEWVLMGGDFGWKHDPTCIVKVARQNNDIYCQVFCYNTGMLNKDIADFIKRQGLDYNYLYVWDSANLKDIEDLNQLGVSSVGAEKGSGSKAWGLSKMQEFNLHVYKDELSELLFQELSMLVWIKDRSGNYKYNSLGQRVASENEFKFNGYNIKDHAVDAVRYALTYYLVPYNNND